jgi:5'-3' exonuclease
LIFQVKLGEPGWRDRYYEEKFGVKTPQQIEEIRRDVVSKCTTIMKALILHNKRRCK